MPGTESTDVVAGAVALWHTRKTAVHEVLFTAVKSSGESCSLTYTRKVATYSVCTSNKATNEPSICKEFECFLRGFSLFQSPALSRSSVGGGRFTWSTPAANLRPCTNNLDYVSWMHQHKYPPVKEVPAVCCLGVCVSAKVAIVIIRSIETQQRWITLVYY